MTTEQGAVFTTAPTPCDIIEDGRKTRGLYVDARAPFSAAAPYTPVGAAQDAERLLAAGFHPKNNGHFERKECPACTACLPVRIPLAHFSENAEHRRIRRANAHMIVTGSEGLPDIQTGGYANPYRILLRRYYRARFDPEAFFDPAHFIKAFEGYSGFSAHHLSARDPDQRLGAAMIYHIARASAYGTMFFYDPALRRQGIGHFMMLNAIAALKARGVQKLYLGHWTNQASSYSWKDKYAPLEVFRGGGWSAPMDAAAIRALRVKNAAAYPAPRQLTPGL